VVVDVAALVVFALVVAALVVPLLVELECVAVVLLSEDGALLSLLQPCIATPRRRATNNIRCMIRAPSQ
jgi:hypothetical protein